jgi:hypothetical protein
MSSTTYADRKALFDAFMVENPHVYGEIVARARRAKERGARIGLRCIWEAIRYDFSVAVRHDKDAPRLNDWLCPFFARLVDAQEPDLRGYFDLRGHDASRLAAESSPNNQNEVSR